jgi:TrmH family RNA methyltransferase
MIKIITSRQNSEIKLIQELHGSKGRKSHKKFIAEGLRTCSTLLAGGCILEQLYVTEPVQQTAHALVSAEKITVVNDSVMEKISTTKTPSGLLGVFHIPQQKPLSAITPGIVLAQIADPGNMGTLIRSAAAMNACVIIIEGVDVFAPKVVQATAGTLAYVSIFRLSWQELTAHKGNLKLCALVVDSGKKPHELDLNNSLLVIGSEAHGIPEQWIADCEQQLTLTMPGYIESLNAATAGSIALYLARCL